MSYGAKQYKQTNVLTASREQILIMLYEACIRHLKRAATCTEKKDLNGKGIALGKAHDIINELASSLNFEVGGKVSEDLERLYNFMTEQLIKANIENSPDKIRHVQSLMENLLDGWKGAIRKLQEEGQQGK